MPDNIDFSKKIDFMFYIVAIFIAIVFVFILLSFISPKFRAKLMGKQIKAAKYMLDENEKDLTHIYSKSAKVTEDGIKTTVHAIKEGWTEDKTIYCKYCGNLVDEDSKYCDKCGKKL